MAGLVVASGGANLIVSYFLEGRSEVANLVFLAAETHRFDAVGNMGSMLNSAVSSALKLIRNSGSQKHNNMENLYAITTDSSNTGSKHDPDILWAHSVFRGAAYLGSFRNSYLFQ
ncbi:uncharacterized protein LOC131149377 [Malania oleifera]|uniref:uncharacterized protein LOC131149377 n=1 Tax=Malania oleifera TaxID=397392 RepID=UPI0025AE1A55|nr:uncharacterized protein LOC131149377 [Malania oleifera]